MSESLMCVFAIVYVKPEKLFLLKFVCNWDFFQLFFSHYLLRKWIFQKNHQETASHLRAKFQSRGHKLIFHHANYYQGVGSILKK